MAEGNEAHPKSSPDMMNVNFVRQWSIVALDFTGICQPMRRQFFQ